jgi:hypothetical protein
MFTQLSLFDLPTSFDAVSPVVTVNQPEARPAAVVVEQPVVEKSLEPVRIYGDARPGDTIQPLGDLARLVIARYEMVARRREEMMRRKVEQPRKSIRVLSPT